MSRKQIEFINFMIHDPIEFFVMILIPILYLFGVLKMLKHESRVLNFIVIAPVILSILLFFGEKLYDIFNYYLEMILVLIALSIIHAISFLIALYRFFRRKSKKV